MSLIKLKKISVLVLGGLVAIAGITGCGNKSENLPNCEIININAFSINQDRELGLQVQAEIAGNQAEYPVLDSVQYRTAYQHLRRIRDKVLNSGKVTNKDRFTWEVQIIRNDSVLNAFCTPGGYIYVYTGLIKYLDAEDDLAGVMGHEIAHADLRHSTRTMTREYGVDVMLKIIAGSDAGALTTLVRNLASLKYSRCHESEADAASVEYLSGTNYACNATASFFEKLSAAGGQRVPQFLSTHPSPDNRVKDINALADKISCNKSPLNPATYAQFKASLP